MSKTDNTSDLNFLETEKFLKNILELQDITAKLLKNREEMRADLKRLDEVVHSIHNEIHRSDKN